LIAFKEGKIICLKNIFLYPECPRAIRRNSLKQLKLKFVNKFSTHNSNFNNFDSVICGQGACGVCDPVK
jgi:hypothetical protein